MSLLEALNLFDQNLFFKKNTSKVVTLTIDDFKVEVTYKPIKNLYLRVSRRTGEIRVSAPQRTSQKVIYNFVLSRANWIEKHLANPVEPEPELQYVDGEKVPFFGAHVPLMLDYVNKNINAYLHNSVIVLQVKSTYGVEKREQVLQAFYRSELKAVVDIMIKKWEPIMGVRVKEFGIKKMKTRWGTCNIRDQRIWLNLHLVKQKPEVIEMVVVHEMVHLLERLHSKRFYALMDHFLPDWKARSEELDGKVC